ncbi:YsnF/AvaK domain-containing protein [uncultured Sphingomonas sp.]|uniref:YsnF/AvaK domain-containing protein n=1 Tax=uncultured Sphingomonas sp. TaxID=158754 RepID=UPI0035C94C6C
MHERDASPLAIPIIEEAVIVDKIAVTTDAVRIRTSVETHDVLVEDQLERSVLRIERIAADRAVETAPPPREEGDTMIVSVVEERLVIGKRLFVVEEIHVTREQTQKRVAIPVTLRRTQATIEHPAQETTGSKNNG